jgi:agmatinase
MTSFTFPYKLRQPSALPAFISLVFSLYFGYTRPRRKEEVMHFLGSEFPQTAESAAFFHIIPVPLEATVSCGKGTAKGPDAILKASQELEVWDGQGIPGEAGFYTAPPVPCETSRKEYSLAIRQAAARALAARSGAARHSPQDRSPVPIILGGEHSLTLPVMQAFTAHYPKGSLGIVHFDAHADLRSELDGNPYSHGCVMRRIHEELHIPIMQLGVRALSPEEIRYREEHSIIHIDASTLARQNIQEVPIPAGFPQLVFISFDLDALDPSIMPATGTPVPGGIEWYQTLSLIESVTRQRAVVGMDMVELSPIAGLEAPSFLAADLLHKMMGFVLRNCYNNRY